MRALRKNKLSEAKQSVLRGMLRNKPTTYWKSKRAIRKNNYNSTQIVDGTSGDANIANLFRCKYGSLFNSVESTEDELTELNEHIKSAIASKCDCPDTTKDKNHCHEIGSSDVSNAIVKIKSDKISDNGFVYSNNFIFGTNLLYRCLSILFTSMIHHGFAPQTFTCANVIPIPNSAKEALTCSDKYHSIAISSVIGKILGHIIIDRQSEFLKPSDYQCGFKSKFSAILLVQW